MVVHEVIHSLEEGQRERFLLKLDLSKAYDRMDWMFLNKVLGVFGFNKKIRKIISQLISTPTFMVMVNGSPSNFFKSSKVLGKEILSL